MLALQLSRAGRHASLGLRALSSSPQRQLQLTDKCVERIRELNRRETASEKCLRLSVEPGGCSGFQYRFNLDEQNEMEEDDIVFEKGGAKLVVDEASLALLDGSTVDFEETMMSTSFVVLNNPQSGSSCGCGTSFQAKD